MLDLACRALYRPPVLTCNECGCVSYDAKGWVAVLAQDPDEDPHPFVIVYCQTCAVVELGWTPPERENAS